MNKLLVKILSSLIIIFRIVSVFLDINTKSFSWSIYNYGFNEIGNDYYLMSIASYVYLLSAVVLLISLFCVKKQRKLLTVSIAGILLASVIEIIVYFLFQRVNMFVPSLIIRAGSLFLGSLSILVCLIVAEIKGRNIIALKIASIFAIVLYLIYCIWQGLNNQSINLTLDLSYILNFLIYSFVCDINKDNQKQFCVKT